MDFASVDQTRTELFAAEWDYFLPVGSAPAIGLVDATGADLHPVHANLMPDGRVLLIGKRGNAGILTPPPLGSTMPAQIQLAPAPVPVDIPVGTVFENRYDVSDSLFCSGHTQLADGTFYAAGGTRSIYDRNTNLVYIKGLSYGMRFDGATWTRTGDFATPGAMAEHIRWYPQATKLEDGRVLILSGWEMPLYGPAPGGPWTVGASHVTAEIYDPATGTYEPLTGADTTPKAAFNPDYSHVFTLPYVYPVDGFVLGESSAPSLFGIADKFWLTRMNPRPGNILRNDGTSIQSPNNGASSVMLPIRLANTEWGYFNGAALVAGGSHNTPNEHSIDVYDVVADRWLPRLDMETRRHHPSTVLMPDGRVLVVAGHDDTALSGNRIQKAIYVDPAAAFRITEGVSVMGEVRGYHTVTLLLPDGRVLVGGGRSAGPDTIDDEKPTLRFYHPGYIFRQRPALSLAPAALQYGQTATIAFTGDVTDVVLIAAGSMTHSFDAHQRYVQLAHTTGAAGVATITAPPNRETAPAGYYMLFALDGNRTPSAGRLVHVGP